MTEFFTARAEGYDEHMLSEVPGCREGYIKMAQLVPKSCRTLLDLGCGTGLELDEIFKTLPEIQVTGVDLTQAMLDRLRKKHPDKRMNLICGDYFHTDLGVEQYDCAVSFQTMHHFSEDAKRGLFQQICRSLRPGAVYIECDYMVGTQEEEDLTFAENARLRREQNVPEGFLAHYDTPCAVANEQRLLLSTGFTSAEKVFRVENTTILVCKKGGCL